VELSRRSGVPRSTIKFYLREGLLAPGEASAPKQARYGEAHLERLRLIRALREVARLPLDVIGRVTRELDRGVGRRRPDRRGVPGDLRPEVARGLGGRGCRP
jgi:DNA-binding transcriptional MerR regulator